MIKHYILENKQIKETDLETAAHWFEIPENRVVKQQYIGLVKVSTVFLMFDHNLMGRALGDDSPPILFETMIFGGVHDQYQKRCATYVQAQSMHNTAVALVRKSMWMDWASIPFQRINEAYTLYRARAYFRKKKHEKT